MSEPFLLDPADRDPRADQRLRRWIAFQQRFAFRPQEAVRALERASDPHAGLGALGVPAADSEQVALLARAGVVGVPFPSRVYPERLRRLSDPPPLLWVRGDPALLSRPAVAVVGARAPTAYGRRVARSLGRILGGAGVVVVSGLARGIDAEAHQGAIDACGPTVAFLGCGPDRVYPAAHRRLADRIAVGGAVVSEFPLGTAPRPPNFPLRNRLIARVSLAVVVVEARERSGSLLTARHAADQGVEVLAVPGPIDSPTSGGPNSLIRDGARPLLELRDVFDAAGLDFQNAPEGAAEPRSADTAIQRALLRALADAPQVPDALARALGVTPEALAQPLLELELAGRVERDRDGRLRSVSRVPSGAGPLGGKRGGRL